MVELQKRKIRWAISLFLVILYFSGLTAQAQYGGGSETTASAETNTYVFLSGQSTVVQTGGIAGVHWTYSVEGLFQLTVAPDAGSASFAHVDANATDDSPSRRTLDPNEVFNMTSLLGTLLDDTTISFTGKAADGSDVLITVTIEDDLAYLVGQTIPPPNTADFFLFSLDAVAQRKYGGGSGEPNDPYQIATAENLMLLGDSPEDYDKHFILTDDIDLDPNLPGRKVFDRAIIAPGTASMGGSFRGASFIGVFDGNGHTISNFSYIPDMHANGIGLFGHVRGENAQIKDLGLIDSNIDAGTGVNVGSLVGWLSEGTISNCYVEGSSISGENQVGGLVGFNWDTITDCYATGSVSGDSGIGGLVGDNWGTIANCYATPSVWGNSEVGGLVGENDDGTITNCYATGSISGNAFVGGLVGENNFGTITNCYSVGRVTGPQSMTGGLVGNNQWGTVTASFWDVETSGRWSNNGGTGKTTAEMKDPNTFIAAGWNFVGAPDGPHDIWAEPAGGGYPVLWWQFSPPPELPTFSGGTGEPDDPYLVSTAADLNSIGHNPRLMRAHFKLTNDIDLAGIDFYIIGSEAFPFTGVFDGNGHTISNFSYTSTDENYIGLFGYISGENTKIKDLGLIDPNIDAGTGDTVGSLVGWVREGSIINCYAQGGSVSGTWTVGGLVGDNYGTITNCYAQSGSVMGTVFVVGGLVGSNLGTITDCYATGSVSGDWAVGGLVGENYYGLIINCYSAGPITGDYGVGGLIGGNYKGEVSNSLWDVQTSGQSTSDGGTGKTTAEMQTESTFTDAGWDFVSESVNGIEDIWSICEGTNYPRLAWQIPAGDFVCPDGITIEDFVFFAEYWRYDNCAPSNYYCQGTDLDFSGTVDEADLEILVESWLEGGELEN